jgi:OOP family OmpA-OmpF porin
MFKTLAIAAALAAVASSACAGESKGFYGGLNVGTTKVDIFDSKKVGAGGFVGYSFNQYVALELGYRQLGEWEMNGGTVKLYQTDFSVIGSYPLSPEFDIYGRYGRNSGHADSSVPGVTFTGYSDSALFGAGLGYKFTPTISGRVEVQQPAKDVTIYGVGIVFRF